MDCFLIANARCLSEGIDVPALDGVAFIDPKSSEVDILQAVGRAIRLSDQKQIGTIVIPVFIPEDEDPDEILSTQNLAKSGRILNALRSHDDVLGEHLDSLRVSLGRKQKIAISSEKIILDLPEKVSSAFVDALSTKLVRATSDSWLGACDNCKFKEKHKHCKFWTTRRLLARRWSRQRVLIKDRDSKRANYSLILDLLGI